MRRAENLNHLECKKRADPSQGDQPRMADKVSAYAMLAAMKSGGVAPVGRGGGGPSPPPAPTAPAGPATHSMLASWASIASYGARSSLSDDSGSAPSASVPSKAPAAVSPVGRAGARAKHSGSPSEGGRGDGAAPALPRPHAAHPPPSLHGHVSADAPPPTIVPLADAAGIVGDSALSGLYVASMMHLASGGESVSQAWPLSASVQAAAPLEVQHEIVALGVRVPPEHPL